MEKIHSSTDLIFSKLIRTFVFIRDESSVEITVSIIQELSKKDSRIKIIKAKKEFGIS